MCSHEMKEDRSNASPSSAVERPLVAVISAAAEGAEPEFFKRLAEAAGAGTESAGGRVLKLHVKTADNVDVPPEQLRQLLPFREVLADAVTAAAKESQADGLLLMPSCAEEVAGMLMAALRLDLPAVVLNAFEPEKNSVGVANLPESLGLALSGVEEETGKAGKSGRAVVEAVKNQLTPRRIVSSAALRNAVACDMATGGSTDCVLHLLALGAESKVPLTLDDIDRIGRATPLLYLPTDGKNVVAPVMAELLDAGLAEGQVLTVSGRSLKENLEERPHDADVRSGDGAYAADGGIAVLHGTVAPLGAVVKQSRLTPDMKFFEGPARVFNSEKDAVQAVRDGKIQAGEVLVIRYEGPRSGSGMPVMREIVSALEEKELTGRVALLSDGRFCGDAVLAVSHVAPEAPGGSTVSVLDNGDVIRIDIEARELHVIIDPEILGVRRLMRDPLPASGDSEFLLGYAAWAKPASEGVVFKKEF